MGRHYLPREPARTETPLEAAENAVAAMARADPKMFARYVIRDELTHVPIKLAPMHAAWHDLMSARDRVILWAMREGGKTVQFSICRVLWELGRNPNLRVVILSNTHTQAVKIVRTLKWYVESSEELHRVFPHLARAEPWSDASFFVQRRGISKDPSVQATGYHGNVLGGRADLLIVDDVLDWENCRTKEQREAFIAWYAATVPGLMTPSSRMWAVGTAFHPEDWMHQVARQWGADAAYRYPVLDDAGQPRWPERWPLERVERRRAELGPHEFARQMLCQPRDDAASTFKAEWIERCLLRGRKRAAVPRDDPQYTNGEFRYNIAMLGPGCKVFTGVDLAVQPHSAADKTAFATIVVHPNGDRELVNLEAGRWSGPEIVLKIIAHAERYGSVVIVENNAAQDFVLQFTRATSAVPLLPFTTGRNKAHPEFGVQSIAAEMAGGKWILPSGDGRLHPEVQALRDELIYFDPSTHTGDRLMALWFAREGIRMTLPTAETGHLNLMRR